jgi:hypothetical protein
MAEEIKFRLPSAIKYAYVDVKGTAEELSRVNFEMLAALYANGLSAFQTAEVEAAKLIVQGAPPAPGQTLVGPPSQKHLDALSEVFKDPLPMELAKATGMDNPVETVKEQLGATEIASAGAPWEAAPKAAGPKPWENAKPATKSVVEIEGW